MIIGDAPMSVTDRASKRKISETDFQDQAAPSKQKTSETEYEKGLVVTHKPPQQQ